MFYINVNFKFFSRPPTFDNNYHLFTYHSAFCSKPPSSISVATFFGSVYTSKTKVTSAKSNYKYISIHLKKYNATIIILIIINICYYLFKIITFSHINSNCARLFQFQLFRILHNSEKINGGDQCVRVGQLDLQ